LNVKFFIVLWLDFFAPARWAAQGPPNANAFGRTGGYFDKGDNTCVAKFLFLV
jgi:hypothetical protein